MTQPSQSVDVLGGAVTDGGAAGRRRARHLFWALGVVALVCWAVTVRIGLFGSETDGIRASWFAIYPSGASLAGLVALNNGQPPGKAVLIAFVTGFFSSGALWFFFEGIWPSL